MAAAQGAVIHHVVVQQGGRVQEFDHRGEANWLCRAFVAAEARGEQCNQRAQALAASVDDVAADFLDEGHGGRKLFRDQAIDGVEVVPNEGEGGLWPLGWACVRCIQVGKWFGNGGRWHVGGLRVLLAARWRFIAAFAHVVFGSSHP